MNQPEHRFRGFAEEIVRRKGAARGNSYRALTVPKVNLDTAAATEMATLNGYRDLAEAYLAIGRDADGLRAVKKYLRINYP